MELVSESYALALLLMFLVVPVLMDLLRDGLVPARVAAWRVLVCAIFIPVICITKIPVGCIWSAALVIALVLGTTNRMHLQICIGLLFAAAGVVISFLLIKLLIPTDIRHLVAPLSFARENVRQFAGNLFICMCSLILLNLRPASNTAHRQRLLFFFFALCLVANIPGLLFQFAQGGAVYLVNAVTWLALVTLAAQIYEVGRDRRSTLISGLALISALALATDTTKWRRSSETIEFIQSLQNSETIELIAIP